MTHKMTDTSCFQKTNIMSKLSEYIFSNCIVICHFCTSFILVVKHSISNSLKNSLIIIAILLAIQLLRNTHTLSLQRNSNCN